MRNIFFKRAYDMLQKTYLREAFTYIDCAGILIPWTSLIQHYTSSSPLKMNRSSGFHTHYHPIKSPQSSVLHPRVVTTDAVIDIDCWDSGRSVNYIWSSWRGHLENTPLAFTLNIPLLTIPSFTFFCYYSSPQSLSQLSCVTETIHKSRLHEPVVNFYTFSIKKRRVSRTLDLFFPSFLFPVTHSHPYFDLHYRAEIWTWLQGGKKESFVQLKLVWSPC